MVESEEIAELIWPNLPSECLPESLPVESSVYLLMAFLLGEGFCFCLCSLFFFFLKWKVFQIFYCYRFVILILLSAENLLCILIILNFIETFFMAQFMRCFGEYFIITSKECIFCYCWVECSVNAN